MALAPEEEAPIRQLLTLLAPLPDPWDRWLAAQGEGWCSWAQVDPHLLQWQGHRQPLAPLRELMASGALQRPGLADAVVRPVTHADFAAAVQKMGPAVGEAAAA